jgi:hypothetical protein
MRASYCRKANANSRIAGSNRDVLFAAYRVAYRPTFYSPGQEHLQEKVARTVI